MDSLEDRVVVVTGAAGGIGTALAHSFAGEGAHLVLVDRDADRLAPLVHAVDQVGRVPTVGEHRVPRVSRILLALEPVGGQYRCADLPEHAVHHEQIPARQQRTRIGAQVGPNETPEHLYRI